MVAKAKTKKVSNVTDAAPYKEVVGLLSPKNPFHVLIGRWLAKQRQVRTPTGSTSEAAQAFELTGTNGAAFIRAVESGASPLPTDKALALSIFAKISFTRAAELVTLVRHLDALVPKTRPRLTDLKELELKVQKLRPVLPHYGAILDWLILWLSKAQDEKTISEANRELFTEADTQVDVLDKALRQTSSQVQIPGVSPPSASLESKLSPIVADIVRDTVEKLALFSPHVNYDSLQNWERLNAHRMKNQWGYISRPGNINESFSSAFDWNFLLNKHRPNFTLITSSKYQEKIESWNSVIKNSILLFFRKNPGTVAKIPKVIEDAVNRISIMSLPADQDGGTLIKLLDFDFRTRKLLGDADDEERNFLIDQGYARPFNNVWIYELENSDGTSSFVAILDDFDYENPRPHFFSITLDAEDVTIWIEKLGLAGRS